MFLGIIIGIAIYWTYEEVMYRYAKYKIESTMMDEYLEKELGGKK